jgi:hypothetical protein
MTLFTIILLTNNTKITYGNEITKENNISYPLWYKLAQNYQTPTLFEIKKTPVIAVIDTGIDAKHPALVGKILAGYNAIDDKEIELSDVKDGDGHGTHVAGIITANSKEYKISGILENVKILPIIALGVNGSSDKIIIRAIEWAINKQVDVINLSLGRSVNPFENSSMEICNTIKKAKEKNIFVVVSAGNSGNQENPINYPAACKYSITVSAINKDLKAENFSNYDENIFISAPGVDILSTLPKTITQVEYGYMSGTSMAAPMISSIIALYKSIYPKDDYNAVKKALINSSIDIASKGKDPYTGYGIIDIGNLVNKSKKKNIKELINNIKNNIAPEITNIKIDKDNRYQLYLNNNNFNDIKIYNNNDIEIKYSKNKNNYYILESDNIENYIYLTYSKDNIKSLKYYNIPIKTESKTRQKIILKELTASISKDEIKVNWDIEDTGKIDINETIILFINIEGTPYIYYREHSIIDKKAIIVDPVLDYYQDKKINISIYNQDSRLEMILMPSYDISINQITAGNEKIVIKGDSKTLCYSKKIGCKATQVELQINGSLVEKTLIMENLTYYFIIEKPKNSSYIKVKIGEHYSREIRYNV